MSGQGDKVRKYPLQLSLDGSPRSYRVNQVDFLVESRFALPPCKTDLRDRFEKIIQTGSAHLTIPEEADKIKGEEYDPTVGRGSG